MVRALRGTAHGTGSFRRSIIRSARACEGRRGRFGAPIDRRGSRRARAFRRGQREVEGDRFERPRGARAQRRAFGRERRVEMRAAGRERSAEQTANRLGAILGSRGCGERKPDASPSLRRAAIERRDLVRLGGYEVVTEARVKYSTALSVAVRATQGRSASRTSDASVAIRRSMSAFVMTAPTMPACR